MTERVRRRGLVAVLALALAGLLWTPYDPQAQDFLAQRLAGPSAAHWLGIDGLGRDVLSRLWRGVAHTIVLGATAAGLALTLATGLLAVERKAPAWGQALVRNLVAVALALPVLLVGLLLLVFLRPAASTLVVAVALGSVPLAFRQLRVMWLEQAGALYVLASRALGATPWQTVRFSVWPNLRPQLAGLARLLFAVAVLELSGLTFLGLTGDPDFAELGALLRQNQAYLFQRPGLVLWPGLMLTGLLLAVHAAGVRPVRSA
jgi:peptide/nickel transport system permease protein